MSEIPRRPYTRSGDMLSIVGFGGIIVMNEEQPVANRVVAEAVESGINYFDVAPSYQDAQDKLGPALEPFRRNVFLACKTTERTAEGARRELNQSLKTLRTDHFDLYQLHAITDVKDDVEAVFSSGGAMEVLEEAKKAGVIRHVGFSAHSVEAALAAMNLYDFDSVLFPINYSTWTKCRFGPQVVEEAERRGMGRLALKAMARGRWKEEDRKREQHPKLWYEPVTEDRLIELALRFTLSQSITAALPPGQYDLFARARDVARDFRPITKEEIGELDELLGAPEPLFDPVSA